MNKTVSTIGGIFVIILMVVFIVTFRQDTDDGPNQNIGPNYAIHIQDTCIPTTHFWAAYHLAGNGRDTQYLKSMSLRHIVADGLIDRWLLNQNTKHLGITVNDNKITSELANGHAYISLPADKKRTMAFYLGLLNPQPQRVS